MIVIFFFIFLLTIYLPKYSICYEYGFDNTETCDEYRQRRAKQLKLPCKEILELGYCLTAGNNYPWKAVNHFINENRGLMKRLYGKQEQFSMLSTELQSNFINQIDEIYDIKKFSRSPKYGRSIDDGKTSNKNYKLRTKLLKIANSIYNTKFVYNTNLDIDNELPIIIKALNSNKYDESILDAVNMSIETNFLDENDIVANSTRTISSFKNNNISMTNESQSLTINNQTESKTKSNESFTTTDFNINLETTTLEIETTSYNQQDNNKPKEKIEVFEKNDLDNEFEPEIETFQYEGVNACEVTEEVVAPYWANSTSGETLALLNTYPYEQYVHWEKCRSINQKMHCRKGCRCEQQHRLYRLLAYDPKNECRGVFMDWFKLPCCCICKCYDIPTKIKMSSRTPRGLRKQTFYNFKKEVFN